MQTISIGILVLVIVLMALWLFDYMQKKASITRALARRQEFKLYHDEIAKNVKDIKKKRTDYEKKRNDFINRVDELLPPDGPKPGA